MDYRDIQRGSPWPQALAPNSIHWHVQHANSIYNPRPFDDFRLPVTQCVCLNGTALVNLPFLVKWKLGAEMGK